MLLRHWRNSRAKRNAEISPTRIIPQNAKISPTRIIPQNQYGIKSYDLCFSSSSLLALFFAASEGKQSRQINRRFGLAGVHYLAKCHHVITYREFMQGIHSRQGSQALIRPLPKGGPFRFVYVLLIQTGETVSVLTSLTHY